MKDTNEIEKQLQRKADDYLQQKAKEMFLIHEEIVQHIGGSLPSYIDYIGDYRGWKDAYSADKGNFFNSSSPSETKTRYELLKTYRKRLVAKYTKELLAKLDILG